MASVNPLSRELVFKIVYYGPGLGGKTTTLEYLHATAKPEHRGKLVSLATPVDRTLYFDFLPIRLPPVRGMNVRLQLFTVPGQVYFNATRKLVLTGADGLVFVSDSQGARADANLESLANLRENLVEQGRDIAEVPLVFQHNKRDLPEVLPLPELDAMLNAWRAPSVGTSAKTGLGVYEGLEAISGRVLSSFATRMPEAASDRAVGFAPAEGGLAGALRTASSQAPRAPKVVARIKHQSAPDWPSLPPNTSIEEAEPPRDAAAPSPQPSPHPSPKPAAEMLPSPSPVPRGDRAPPAPEPRWTEEPEPVLPRPPPVGRMGKTVPAATPSNVGGPVPHAAATGGFTGVSFAELWPEGEREIVSKLEAALAEQRLPRAIELCDTLVSRVLASAAGLFGSTEAPRDPVIVPVLLGLDGRRYLAFRAIVREARSGGLVLGHHALAAYAFAIDARLARSSIAA